MAAKGDIVKRLKTFSPADLKAGLKAANHRQGEEEFNSAEATHPHVHFAYRELHAYGMLPIDLWFGWQNFSASSPEAKDLLSVAWDMCHEMRFGDGSVREGPFMTGLPAEGCCETVIGWKFDNNGDTFIVSPFPLPWLTQLADKTLRYGLEDIAIALAEGEAQRRMKIEKDTIARGVR